MQLSRIGLSFGLVLLLANAALAQKVTTDFAKDVEFRQYKTFMWINEPKPDNPLVAKRIVDDVNAALAAKGLTLVTSGADLGIAAHAATQTKRSLNTFYDGFGGGWRWRGFGGFGSATTQVNTYEVGTLVVDMFDTRTKEALWRGTATKTLSDHPQKNTDNLNKAITRMFKDFPPSNKTRTH
jgi:hypothetical protein